LAHALFRAAEVIRLRGQPLQRPVLDLGCGSGDSARAAMIELLDYGLDLSGHQLRGAKLAAKYRQLCQADARAMPFANGSFATVLSVSVLEHIEGPERVVGEAFRVLRPGGVFVGTLVLDEVHRHLFYPRLLERMGLAWLGRVYRRGQDRLFRHRTLLSEEAWRGLWRDAGFEVEECRRVVSPRVTRLWDMLLPLAFPYWLGRKLGVSVVWHPRFMVRWLEKVVAEEARCEDNRGSCLFFVLRKPGGEESEAVEADAPEEELALQPA